ncbi:hypothetical protein BDQ17DRAFT_314370 [Cyathus striatus]|nr:hypothetical protein BDQ17DRAFT_314370 [Cyathus striatus]
MEVEPGEVLLAEERADVAMKEELNEDGATETLQQRAADPGEDPKEEIVPNGEVGMDGESDMVLQAVEALLGMAGGALERPADAPAAIHPTAARAPGRRKTKAQAAGETVVFSMVHGDVIVLSGDDFQFSIKRSGTSILLIGSQDEGRE